MPFTTLLLTCLAHGTQFRESGQPIRVEPCAGETVLFFAIDNQSNQGCGLRALLANNDPLCDVLIFHRTARQTTLCLVELKGRDIAHGVQQVIATHRALKARVEQACAVATRVTWKACILTHGKAPKQEKNWKQTLETTFGKRNSMIQRNPDLGDFLRR